MVANWVQKANAMLPAPERPEIDQRTIKVLVGAIAIGLPILTNLFANGITSISASYYEEGWSRSIFIGFLFAIAAFLVAYNGLSKTEMILSKIASVAALGVALFPCGCDGKHCAPVPYVHAISTTAMFVVLTWFCWIFFRRSKSKGYPQAKVRAAVYFTCGVAMLLSILGFAAIHWSSRGDACGAAPRAMFWAEAAGLVAFGISWLTASHVLPGLERTGDRFLLFGVNDRPCKPANASPP